MASEALLFLLLKINLAGGAAILAVLAARGAMRRWFGAGTAYALWLAVPAAAAAVMLPAREEVISAAPEVASVAARDAGATAGWLDAPAAGSLDVWFTILVVWITGAVTTLAVMAWRQAVFARSLGRLKQEERGVARAEADGVGPAIVGALAPKLVLPKDFEARFDAVERDVVLAHERVHLRRGDPQINALAALAQCVCWFNPLVHAAVQAMRIDQELACDAAVIAKFPDQRRRYAEAMLKTQLPAHFPALVCAWPASGHPLKQRIAMLKRELPGEVRLAQGAIAAALLVIGASAAAWAAQPPVVVLASAQPTASRIASLRDADADLVSAVLWGSHWRAEKALDAGADVNARTGRGLTVLTLAARADETLILDLLLDRGADVNLTSPGEGSALVAAGRRGQLRAVAMLLDQGADVNMIGPGQGTPLVAAVRTGHLGVVRRLVEHGADVNLASPFPAPWDRWGRLRTPLEAAEGGDHHAIAEYLKLKGARM